MKGHGFHRLFVNRKSTCAVLRVEFSRVAENIQENDLDDIFGFAFILDDPQGYAEDEPLITVDDYRQGVVVAVEQWRTSSVSSALWSAPHGVWLRFSPQPSMSAGTWKELPERDGRF